MHPPPPPPPPHQHSRINLADLKAQIVKRVGLERSQQYFYYLSRLLSLKLSKVEFNKLCFRVLGRENVPLHNHFLRSILRNACRAKVAPQPPTPEKEVPTFTNDGYQQSEPYHFLNGDVLPSTGTERPEILFEQIRKVDSVTHQLVTTVDNVILGNGDCDIRKPVQHHQRAIDKAESEGEVLLSHPAKLTLIKGSTDSVVSVHSNDQREVLVAEDGKERSNGIPLPAPIGIPFCSVSVGGAHRALPLASIDRYASSYDSGVLIDTEALRERMQLIAAAQGLEAVSMECANFLNNGLDAYLKGLIKSCIELNGARCGCDLLKNSIYKHQSHGNLNGVLADHRFQLQSTSRPLEGIQENRQHSSISLLDFQVAMELNPQQLGEDWPVLLEKICMHAFEE